MKALGHNSAESVNRMAEAMKYVYADVPSSSAIRTS